MNEDKYIHSEVENDIYSYWEKKGLFKPKKNSKKFSIVIPPPNVTGSLHMGHALNNSIQDLLVRYHRMNNYETLWQPGTDHAGIITQLLVEKDLEDSGVNKHDLGRENFLSKVWEWKEKSGDNITNQLISQLATAKINLLILLVFVFDSKILFYRNELFLFVEIRI